MRVEGLASLEADASQKHFAASVRQATTRRDLRRRKEALSNGNAPPRSLEPGPGAFFCCGLTEARATALAAATHFPLGWYNWQLAGVRT